MTTTTKLENLSLEALQDRRQRLAPEAESDQAAAAEIALIETAIHDQERQRDRADLARAERERRAAEETKRQDEARRAEALERARADEARLRSLDETIDQTFAALIGAALEYHDLHERMLANLIAADRRELRDHVLSFEAGPTRVNKRLRGAFSRALIEADAPGRLFKEPPHRNTRTAQTMSESQPLDLATETS